MYDIRPRSELSVGPISSTRSNATHQTTDPTQPTTLLNSIQPTTNLRHNEDNFMHIISQKHYMTLSVTTTASGSLSISLASVSIYFWKFLRPMTQTTKKLKNLDPTQPVGRPHP